MAHFAELDENSAVLQVLVVHNDVITVDGVEDEQRGIDFLNGLFPDSGDWKQCSYNHNKRGHYPAIGDTYDPVEDVFYGPQPYPSWSMGEDFLWQPPTPKPDTTEFYYWDEDSLTWVIPGPSGDE